jgi:hypothetical protein
MMNTSTHYYLIFKVGENCALIRCDVGGVIELPVNTTIKLNECEESGYLVNTKEWVKQYMDNEEGLAIIMANDEYFNPLHYLTMKFNVLETHPITYPKNYDRPIQ